MTPNTTDSRYITVIYDMIVHTAQQLLQSGLHSLTTSHTSPLRASYGVSFMSYTKSLMTSPGHKIGQILKLIYLLQYLSYSVDQKLKMSEMLMAIFLVYSTSCKKGLLSSKWRPFWKFWNIKHSFNLASDMKRSSQIMPKKVFLWWWRHRWRHRVASKFLSIFMFRRGWLR